MVEQMVLCSQQLLNIALLHWVHVNVSSNNSTQMIYTLRDTL